LITTAADLGELRQVERLLETHGVQVSSCDVSSGNPLDPAVVGLIRRKLDIAQHFGVSVVVGEAGEAADPAELEQLYGHLREIGDAAAARGIVYCCDVAPGICLNHRWMLKAMADLDHSYLRLNFDPGKLLYYNVNPVVEVALAKVCHHVRHVRLKDSMGECGQRYFPALGYGGAVDFLRLRQLLRDCGFTGPYTICVDGIAGEAPLSLEQHAQRLDQSVQTLRECGYFDRV
jgi:inosose dehydratase